MCCPRVEYLRNKAYEVLRCSSCNDRPCAAAALMCARLLPRHRAARLCCEATAALAAASGGAPAFEGPAWNGRTVDLIRLAKAHCGLVLHRTFAASVRRLADEARRPRPGF